MGIKKSHTNEYKAKVVLAAFREDRTMAEAKEGLKHYFQSYNNERSYQSLSYRTPREVYMEKIGWERVSIRPR